VTTVMVDVTIESGSVPYSFVTGIGPYVVSCETGRVIVAITAWLVKWTSTDKYPVVVVRDVDAEGLTSSMQLWDSQSNGVIEPEGFAPFFHYQLTTARIVDLS